MEFTLKKCLEFCVVIGVLGTAVAHGADFVVHAPPNWKQVSFDDHVSVFENMRSDHHERVTLQAFGRTVLGEKESFEKRKNEINQTRARFLKAFGIGNYAVLDLTARVSNTGRFSEVRTLQAKYLDFRGREVQSLERQFLTDRTMYVVTYLVDAETLNDLHSAEAALQFFEPTLEKSRRPAGAEVAKGEPVTEANDAKEVDWTQPSAGVLWGDPDKPLVKDYARLREHCIADGIPAEDVISPEERAVSQATQDIALGCLDGAWDGAKGMAKGVVSGAKHLASGTVNLARDALKYFSDPKYFREENARIKNEYDQVKATVGPLAAEAYKDPSGFRLRVRDALGGVLWKSIGEPYLCLSLKKRMDLLCELGTNLIPIGLLAKLLLKLPLAGEELAQLLSAGKRGFAAITKGAVKVVESAAALGRRLGFSEADLGKFDKAYQKMSPAEREVLEQMKPNELKACAVK